MVFLSSLCGARRMFSLFRHGVHIRLSLSSAPHFPRSRVAPFCRPPHHARTYAAIPPTSLKPTHSIYVSNSTDPYFNLTFEDWSVLLLSVSTQGVDLLVQAFPLPPTKRPALASLQRCTVCCHWTEPESLERSQPGRIRDKRYSLDQATKWWRYCIPCASRL